MGMSDVEERVAQRRFMSHSLDDNCYLDCIMKRQDEFIGAPTVIRHFITLVFLFYYILAGRF